MAKHIKLETFTPRTQQEIDAAVRRAEQRMIRQRTDRMARLFNQAEYLLDLAERMGDVLPNDMVGACLHRELRELKREIDGRPWTAA